MIVLFSDDPASFLTLAEKQRIAKHEIEAVRALESDRNIPGFPKLKLYEGQTLSKSYNNENESKPGQVVLKFIAVVNYEFV